MTSAHSNPHAQTVSDEALLAKYQPVFQRIAEGAIEREESGRRPQREVEWLRESGFTAVRVPRELGGGGATLRQLHLLLIELAAADSNLSHALRVHFRFTEGLWVKRDDPWSEAWLRRIAAGTLVAAGSAEKTGDHGRPATTVSRVGEQFVINGRKYYSTGSIYADYVSVTATNDEGTVSTVLVPTRAAGVEVIDDWSGFGQKHSGSGTTTFTNTVVDAADVLPPAPNSGAKFAHVQLSHLATASGIVRRATEDIIAFVHARQRTYKQASAATPSADPLIQSVIGRADSTASVMRATVLQVASILDLLSEAQWALRQQPPAERDPEQIARVVQLEVDAGLETYRAQTVLLDLALRTTAEIFEVGGSSALDRAKHLDRHWRNVRTLASHNPLIYRHRQLGEYRLHGNAPHNFGVGIHAADANSVTEDIALSV